MLCVNTDTDRSLFTRERLISAGIDVSSLPAKQMRYNCLRLLILHVCFHCMLGRWCRLWRNVLLAFCAAGIMI